MALDGIQGIYPRCLSVPHEGGTDKHRGNSLYTSKAMC